MANIFSSSFLTLILGIVSFSAVSGAVGCVSVLKGESLIGDAIGHATFPGIVLFFMLFMQKNPFVLMVGAMVSGTVAFVLIQIINKNSKLGFDSILAIILSTFFGLGMVLKSYIQGNVNYSSVSQSGLQDYIFGQAAYIMKYDVKLILFVSIISLTLLIIFYKEIKLFVFDEEYAKTIGLNTKILHFLILLITMSLIAVGLKIVGVILISSLLVIPAITALQWSKNFSKVLLISSFVGGISSLVGTFISTVSEMSTGPTIVVIMSAIAIFSLVLGKYGVISNVKFKRRYLK